MVNTAARVMISQRETVSMCLSGERLAVRKTSPQFDSTDICLLPNRARPEAPGRAACLLDAPGGQGALHFTDGLRDVDPPRAGQRAVEGSVAAPHAHRVAGRLQPLRRAFVARSRK